MSDISPISSLWSYFKTKRKKAYKASVYSVLNKIFDIAPPLLIGLAVDTVVKKESSFLADYGITNHLHQIYTLGFLTFLIWALESFFEFLYKVNWRNIAQEVQHAFRMDAYKHLQSLHISFFEDQNTGNLTTIMNDDINQLERFLDIGANDILQVATTVITIGVIFFIISPTIAALSFLPMPFILWGSIYFQKKIAPKYKNVREESGLLASILVNNLAGMATIKSYVAEGFEYQRIEKQSHRFSQANKEAIVLSSSFSPMIRMVILCGFLFTLVLGGIHVFEGKLGVGSYSVLIFLVQRLLWPLTRLGETFDLYQRAMASTQRILNLLKTPIAINDGDLGLTKDAFNQPIVFKDVSFSYEEGFEILKAINIAVNPGETIAFVGTTGSGKSTLLKLLLRFYDISEGAIHIGGKNIKNYEQAQLRSNIGVVSQDTYLFHGTVKENISYGSFNVSEADIIEAAKGAEAHEFILDLPQGYETVVGERGQKLSGGQRQRISIARAMVKKPSLYIFDEATSAIDNETEAAIQKSLLSLTKNQTSIMVAHRLSTIKHADTIYVLEAGSIKESGTHDELIKACGAYAGLWAVQTGAIK